MSSKFYEQHPFHRLPGKVNKSGGHHYRNLCFLSLKNVVIFRKSTRILFWNKSRSHGNRILTSFFFFA